MSFEITRTVFMLCALSLLVGYSVGALWSILLTQLVESYGEGLDHSRDLSGSNNTTKSSPLLDNSKQQEILLKVNQLTEALNGLTHSGQFGGTDLDGLCSKWAQKKQTKSSTAKPGGHGHSS